jgi:hypothetical protein
LILVGGGEGDKYVSNTFLISIGSSSFVEVLGISSFCISCFFL